MNTENEIYRLVSKASDSNFFLSEQVHSGITAYINDNGLNALLSGIPAERRLHCLEMFMKPVLTLPPSEIPLYFETYRLRLNFTLVANRIQEEAEKKWRSNDYRSECLVSLSNEFHSMVSELCNYPSLRERLSPKISDCIIDLDYAAGRTKDISPSLDNRIQRQETGNQNG